MQCVAQQLADKFNRAVGSSGITVRFAPAAVIRAVDRPGQPYYGVERFITGEYRKWNNNAMFPDFYMGDETV
jgi:hypothetical protein